MSARMSIVPYILIALPVVIFGWAYAGYPLTLWLASRFRSAPPTPPDPAQWPFISITVPAFNEAARIRSTIESLLAVDYPADRRQILIVSDASTDDTDRIVGEYADRGVELFRVKRRGGKTAAENEAADALRGEIIVNTDASIRIQPHSVKALVRAFQDPRIGVASGRDISVGAETESNRGESGYVGYEMWVRELETRLGGIVGASGCCYAARAQVQRTVLRDDLARDFASALIARKLGLRAVSINDATAVVPRTPSLRCGDVAKGANDDAGIADAALRRRATESVSLRRLRVRPREPQARAVARVSRRPDRICRTRVAGELVADRARPPARNLCRHRDGVSRHSLARQASGTAPVRARRLRGRVHHRRTDRVDAGAPRNAAADVGAHSPRGHPRLARRVQPYASRRLQIVIDFQRLGAF